MKGKTIRFYNRFGTHMGWKYLANVTYFELINWLKAGNTLRFQKQILTKQSNSNEIFKILRRS